MTDPSPSSDLGPVIEKQDFRARVAFLLRAIEFGDGYDPGHPSCPACGKELFHKPSCELAALLRECEP